MLIITKNNYLQGCKKACRITHKKQLYDQFFCDDLDLEPRHIPCHTDCMLPVNQNIENVRALLHRRNIFFNYTKLNHQFFFKFKLPLAPLHELCRDALHETSRHAISSHIARRL